MNMLHYQEYHQHIAALIQAALAGADPYAAVKRALQVDGRFLHSGRQSYDLKNGRVFVVSVGKAAASMAQAAIDVLETAVTAGVVITKYGSLPEKLFATETLQFFAAAHPISDQASVEATAAVITMLAQTTETDLVLCLISGGASALLTQPLVSLLDWQQLNHALLASGCTINEFNTVRRQLDRVKGGGLVKAAAPAACLSLILSDVVGNPLAVIGSGPTVLLAESPADAILILARYDVAARLDTAVYDRVITALTNIADGEQDQNLASEHVIVGDVRSAAQMAQGKAMQLGFMSQLLTAQLEGEAREVGRVAAAIAKDTPPGWCLIMGGETTVTLRGDGVGGRNQEVALAAAVALDGCERTVVASFATDGDDGPTPAAGAVVSGESVENGRFHHLDARTYLDRNDSYTFFSQLDAAGQNMEAPQPPTLLLTGPSGTNVNDLIFILTYAE